MEAAFGEVAMGGGGYIVGRDGVGGDKAAEVEELVEVAL